MTRAPAQKPLTATAAVPRHDLLVCLECDAVHARPPLRSDAVARCRRCAAILARGHALTPDGQLALAIAAAVVLVIASASPIVTLELRGAHSVATLFEAIMQTWRSGEELIAMLAAATAFAFPLAVILLQLWVLVPRVVLRTGWQGAQRRHRAALALRALRWVTRWSMVEVFMLGILIAVVRSAGVTDVVLGPGIFAFATLTVLLTALQAAGLEGQWQSLSCDPA